MTDSPQPLPANILRTGAPGAGSINQQLTYNVLVEPAALIVEVADEPGETWQFPWSQVLAVCWHPLTHAPAILLRDLGLDPSGFWAAKLTIQVGIPGIISGQAYEVLTKEGWLYVQSDQGLVSIPMRGGWGDISPAQKP